MRHASRLVHPCFRQIQLGVRADVFLECKVLLLALTVIIVSKHYASLHGTPASMGQGLCI